MKLDCVVTSCNNEPMYIDFIPIFVKAWKKLYPNVDVKIILIHDCIPETFKEYEKNIILFPPLPNVSTAFTSQYIRLLYPALLSYTNGVMITDMDILPMNKTYFTEHIKSLDNDTFIYLRENICFKYKEIAMCYNVALPTVWKDIFHITSLKDIKDRINSVFQNNIIIEGHGNEGWSTDQKDLYTYVSKWNTITNKFICLKETDTRFKRLDRNTFMLSKQLKQMIQLGIFSDYHCYRPYTQFKDINDIIVSWL